MRMRELVELSGLPKSTIHFYQREGLLPAPEKSARNAASYSEVHLARLALIGQLRAADLSVVHLKRAVFLVEQGVPLGTAIALQQALDQDRLGMDLEALAAGAGLPVAEVQQDLRAGLLGGPSRRRFGASDLAAVRALAAMRAAGTANASLQQITSGLQDVVRQELALADTLTAGMAQADRSAAILALQDAVDCLHPYWLAQARRQEVFKRWPPAMQKLIREQE